MAELPSSRIPDPLMAPTLRWGILAPGWIAHQMASALQRSSQKVVAVGSRSADRAREFADTYGIERAYGSYEALVSDPDVDVVYVASPHSEHRAQALLAIAAGKHVLVEKAFTRNAAEARDVVDAARAAKVVGMEAMWPRYAPRYDIVRQLLADGALGELISVQADHSQLLPESRVPRLHDPDLAGGAMLDLGVYPVSFVSFVLGTPTEVKALGNLTHRGVDRTVSAVATGFADHPAAVATITTTLAAPGGVTATILGTEGRLELDGRFYSPGSVRLVRPDGASSTAPQVGAESTDALMYQAAHLATLVAEGATESPFLPLDEVIAVMATMDELRHQVGNRLPGE
jgi:predicted dehydrogenase